MCLKKVIFQSVAPMVFVVALGMAFVALIAAALPVWADVSIKTGESMSDQNNNRQSRGGIVLIRHGEAEHNVENTHNSNPEHANYKIKHLTNSGRNQMRATGDRLLSESIDGDSVCKVLVSPLPRTQETANIIMGKLQINSFKKKTEPGLTESGLGSREGQKHDQFDEANPWFPKDPASFDGETTEQIRTRVLGVLNEVLNNPDCDLDNQYVLLVSHGSPIYLMLELLTGHGEKLNPAGYRIINQPKIRSN